MLDLGSDRWAGLSHAYGQARDVPQMLRDLAARPGDEVWEKIWGSLCHQGTTYPASFAAVPHVVALAEGRPARDQTMYWAFVGSVAQEGWKHASRPPDDLKSDYREALERSGPLILRALTEGSPDETDALYLLEALAAVLECPGQAGVVGGLVDGEIPGACPACGADFTATGRDGEIFLTSEEPTVAAGRERTPVEMPAVAPVAPALTLGDFTPERTLVWLPQVADRAGHATLAVLLRRLHGTARCPACGEAFALMRELVRQATEFS